MKTFLIIMAVLVLVLLVAFAALVALAKRLPPEDGETGDLPAGPSDEGGKSDSEVRR